MGLKNLLHQLDYESSLVDKIEALHLKYPKLPAKRWWGWGNIVKPSDWLDKSYIEESPPSPNLTFASRFVQNLKNLYAVCKENNVKYISILQPTLLPEFKVDLTGIETFYYDSKIQSFFKRYKKNYRMSALNYYTRSHKLAKEELGGVFYDFSKIFYNEKDKLYLDWCHYNAKGNKLIALEMKNLITD